MAPEQLAVVASRDPTPGLVTVARATSSTNAVTTDPILEERPHCESHRRQHVGVDLPAHGREPPRPPPAHRRARFRRGRAAAGERRRHQPGYDAGGARRDRPDAVRRRGDGSRTRPGRHRCRDRRRHAGLPACLRGPGGGDRGVVGVRALLCPDGADLATRGRRTRGGVRRVAGQPRTRRLVRRCARCADRDRAAQPVRDLARQHRRPGAGGARPAARAGTRAGARHLPPQHRGALER